MLKNKDIWLLTGVAAATLAASGVAGAQVVSQVAPGSFDGAYADLDVQIENAEDDIAKAEETLGKSTEVRDLAVGEVDALQASLDADDEALLGKYSAVTELVTQQGELQLLSKAVDDAQDAFNTNPTPGNFLALKSAEADFNAAYDTYVADLAAYDSKAKPGTFDALQEQADLAGSAVSTSAADEIGKPAATVADLLAEQTLRDGAAELAETTVSGDTLALTAAQGALAPLQRSDGLLSGASASGQENLVLAAGALVQDPAADGSNYETEVLGALTDHEARIVANADAIVANADAIVAEAEARATGDAETLANANTYTDTSVAAEAALRVEGDAATLASANTYTDTSVAAEAALRVEGDAATLASANTYTDTSVAAEAALRVAGDTALGGRISAEETARIAADTAETNARIAADAALTTKINNVDSVLRDKIASSTATAIALGGAVILPDVNFTLSGNVGFYEGAQAIAINGAARVAPNTYVTGAVGGGLNKRGSVGGRVGVVFGF
jgi:hypothetical protein